MSRLRCAVYTRKSTEEGLDQGFNSLDAQREACTAYIKSQAGEGWTCLKSRYDDGGISGGTMERPALQRLLADIAASKVEIVVVYKVDRLTRALSDFAKMVEIFDAHDVSFVSVTQQFNTTTSMGRLTLNVLLSFAQFEREVTAERIRDKIAASKKKGMWMGGVVPLGYDVVDRKLVPNEPEAETVRTLFQLYLEHGNVRSVHQEADRLGLRTKARKPNNGQRCGGEPFTRGHIYKVLSNPIYIGQIAYKGQSYNGEHPAIVDRESWERVQEQLKRNAVNRHRATNTKTGSLLAGLLVDAEGRKLVPTYANKAGRRYRYYISKCLKERSSHDHGGWRLPAQPVEQAVVGAVSRLLQDKARMSDVLGLTGPSANELKAALSRATGLGKRLRDANPDELRAILLEIMIRTEVDLDQIQISLDAGSLRKMLRNGTQDDQQGRESKGRPDLVTINLPATFKRRGVETKLVLADKQAIKPEPNPALIKAIVQAHQWFEDLKCGRVESIGDLARHLAIHQADVSRRITQAFLAPDIVESIFEGRQPTELTAKALKRLRLPASWNEQRRVLGFTR
jgi:site-specific DNA recombinase